MGLKREDVRIDDMVMVMGAIVSFFVVDGGKKLRMGEGEDALWIFPLYPLVAFEVEIPFPLREERGKDICHKENDGKNQDGI